MLIKLARIYVYFILFIEVSSLLASMLIYFAILTETMQPLLSGNEDWMLAAFCLQVPAVSLAKERNIWRNELKQCPQWLRIVAIVCFIFTISLILAETLLTQNGNWSIDMRFIPCAFVMLFSIFGISVAYSVLWSGALTNFELLKRARTSVISVAIIGVILGVQHAIRAIHSSH